MELKCAETTGPLIDLFFSVYEVGILFNFGPQPRCKRLIFENNRKRQRPSALVGGQASA
jgi:hypothetical protein